MQRLRIGVLRGGPSGEYDISLKTGAAILQNLPSGFVPKDIFVDRNGVWYADGIAKKPAAILRYCDAVINAMHGEYGEDGGVQKILDTAGIPYTGSGRISSALGMHKLRSKELFKKAGLRTPLHRAIGAHEDPDDVASELHRRFPQPVVIKPVRGGSSLGVYLAYGFREIADAVRRARASAAGDVFAEEYIRGTEATCGVIERFRGEELYALPPIEIVPPAEKTFFDFEAKYTGMTDERCPATFPLSVKRALEEAAREAHRALGLRHYSRTDMMVTRRGIYILETNTLPGMTEQSLFPKACAAVGCSFPQFLTHLVELARSS